MISDGRHNRLIITLISLLILSFIYQIFFFDERKIITGVGQFNKLETENELLSAKILLIEKELFSRENDLSSDERTISTLREQIEFLNENIVGAEDSDRKAAGDNSSSSSKLLTDEEWESIEEDDLIEAEIEEVFENEEDFDESSSSEIAADCPLSEDYAENEFKMDIKAKYATRSDKFLTSVLMNGPNNQLIGLRETMFMAIKLNRSYILPKFFKHDHADPTAIKDPFAEISPSFRVSPSKMKQLVNIHPFSEIPQVCADSQISAFYQLKVGLSGTNNGRFFRTCREIDCIVDDLDCEKTASHCFENIAVPVVPEKKPRGRFGQDGNFTILETTYNTAHSCVLMGFPYMDINFSRNIFNSKFSPEDRELMSDIMKATGRPKHMEKVADLFIQKFMKGGFVALHWRYNDDDWWHGGCDIDSGVFKNGGDLEDKGPKLCKKLSLMRKPEIFAQQVNIYLSRKFNAQENEGRTIPENIKKMYIATPPSETKLITKMRDELKLINPEITILMQSELEPFVRNFYKSQNCGELEAEFWEVLSLVELETCLRASIFLGSQGSSWSKNTNIERRLYGYNLLDAGNEIIMPDLLHSRGIAKTELVSGA